MPTVAVTPTGSNTGNKTKQNRTIGLKNDKARYELPR